MDQQELDKLHKKRVDSLAARWEDGNEIEIDDIFISERVLESLDSNKALIEGFKIEEILALAPFSANLYVSVCPYCITPENIEAFCKLTRAGIIVPILIARYEDYPEPVINSLIGLDHISHYEYSFYRYLVLYTSSAGGLCHHCVDDFDNEIRSIVKGKRGAPVYRAHLDQVLSNIHPFLSPDFELLEDIKGAFKSLDREFVSQLSDLSFTIRGMRTSQAFEASLIINESEFSNLPEGIAEEADLARSTSLRLARLVSEGLGLKIPVDIPTDNYIELINDFRPKITKIVETSIVDAITDEDGLSVQALLSSINEINREIERIKGLKRHMLLEAIVGFTSNNRAFSVSTLIAGAMGLGGSLAGCAGTLAAGIGTDTLRKAGKLRGSKSINRLGSKIHRDLMPGMDKLIAKYVGSKDVPMHVLSIRKQINAKKG